MMLDDIDVVDDTQSIYFSFQIITIHPTTIHLFNNYDCQQEKEKETNDDPQFIRDLLAVHDKYIDMVTNQVYIYIHRQL